jgi:hypothetical protein
MIIFLIIFILFPLFIGAALLLQAESSTNKKIRDYPSAITFLCKIITGVDDLTDAKVQTTGGKIIAGIFGLLNLIFIGFVAAIITTTATIHILVTS